MYHILLYYKIVKVDNPEKEVAFHKEVCRALDLNGRILIGGDGINGTVGGSKESIELYKKYMDAHRLFKKIDWKESTSDIPPFPKMRVRVRKEIITTDDRESFDICRRAKHVDRDTFHQWLVRGEDMVILDMRNDYEWEVGRFVNSVRPPMKYFRDLKDNIEWYKENFIGKKVVTFCTGGVRCEPATAMLIKHGFDPGDIYQLEGGIVKYAEKYGNEGYYEGKCYVFDDRVVIDVNTTDSAVVVGRCLVCEEACDTFRNCANKWCNKHFIGCADCMNKLENTCSEVCQETILDAANIRPPREKVEHRNK